MDTPTPRRNDELDRRWDRAWRWALVVSVVLHVLVVLLFRQERLVPVTPFAAAGERAGDPKAAAGGGQELIAYQIEMPPPVPEEIPKPPDPVPVPDAVQPEVEPPEETAPTPSRSEGQQAPLGENRGPDVGPGTETGTGRGDGGTADEGLYRLTAPSPRGMILPPSDRPGRVKGKTVTVYVFVTDAGSVIPDSTRLAPSTGDARFDKRLRDDAAQWKFRPGMRGGQPIAAWFPYTITF